MKNSRDREQRHRRGREHLRPGSRKHTSVAALLAAIALIVTSCGGAGSATTSTIHPSSGASWPSNGLDHSNSVHNRDETQLSPVNVDQLVEAWRVEAGAVTGTPAVVDGRVHFSDWHGVVHAVNARDGSTVWETAVTDVPMSASVAVTDDSVIVADLAGVLHALDRSTGANRWSTNLNPQGASLFASPVAIEDTVVIGMTDIELEPEDPEFRASVVAVDIADGSERWRFYTDPEDDGPGRWVGVWSSAAYDPARGLVFVGTGDTNKPGGGGAGHPSERAGTDLPLADGILAIDHATGQQAWFFKLIEEDRRRDLDVGASPNLFSIGDRDVVGAGGKSGDYVVLDRDTGELIWARHLTDGGDFGGVMSTAAIGDGVIYVASNVRGSNGTIFALDASDGSVLWEQPFDPAIAGGSMALANGVLYRGTLGGTIVALDAGDGMVLWTDEVDAPLAGGLSIVDGTLYVGYGTGAPPRLEPVDGGLVAYRIP